MWSCPSSKKVPAGASAMDLTKVKMQLTINKARRVSSDSTACPAFHDHSHNWLRRLTVAELTYKQTVNGDLWEEKLTSGIDPKAGTEKKNRELLMTWLEPHGMLKQNRMSLWRLEIDHTLALQSLLPVIKTDLCRASPRTVNFISVLLFIPTDLENERDTFGKVSLSAFQIILQIDKLRYG
ncbi:hypothetical protein YC2023_116435 [Brassica napus]